MKSETSLSKCLKSAFELHLKLRIQHKAVLTILLPLVIGFSGLVSGQPLAGTDDLNRTLPQNAAVGNPASGKTVAMFYFLWQGHKTSPTTFNKYDLTEIVANHPTVLNNFNDANWGSTDFIYPAYYWGQSIYNYLKGDDYWVHLKNVQLLTDAGVDLLVLDATNGIVYVEESNALMMAIDAVKAQGKNPPKIAFYTNTYGDTVPISGNAMQIIYNNFYKSGAPYYHPDTWFNLSDKPLIIGKTAESVGRDYQNFFTYRESQWPTDAPKTNGWPWIEFVRPQRVYSNSSGQREIINVSVAQHPNLAVCMGGAAFYGGQGIWGRSYRYGSNGNPATETPYGHNIQEQWDYAISQNVPFVFVTGWNEWIVGRWPSIDGNPNHSLFVDLASAEFGRDIEPSLTGNIKDNYYMQLVANIRKYKGIDSSLLLSDSTTITNMNSWTSVTPVYSDYTGDVVSRNHPSGLRLPANVLAISNFGFESPVIASSPGYVYSPTGASWTFSSLAGIVKNGGGFNNPNAVEGTQAAVIQQNGYFEMTLNFPAAGEYTLRFSKAQRPGYQESFDVYYDNTRIGTFGTLNDTSTSYQQHICLFTANAGNHTIKFIGTKTTDHACFVDNIYIGSSTPAVTYTNTTGRNDFDKLKVARNATNLYFYAKTIANISSNSGSNWMRLYLNTDRYASTGWKGYDFRVIGGTQLQKWVNGAWIDTNTITYTVSGNEIYYTIPRSYLDNIADPINLEFKWSDNMQNDNDPLDWYVNGDAAPGARFNFIATNQDQAKQMGVYNGSFENPSLGSATFLYNPLPNKWTYSALSGVANNGSAFNNPTAVDGVQCGFIQKNSTIYQDINFLGGTYKLTCFAALRPGNTQTINVTCDGVSIGTIAPASSTFSLYSTNNFTVTAGIHRITFTGTNTVDQTAFLDNVDVVLQTTLSNGGFELPSLAPSTFQYNPTPNGWTYSSLSGVARNGSAFNNPTAPEGVQCGFIQTNSSIYQDFSFNAGSYKVSFWAAIRPSNSQTINVFCDDVLIGTITPSSSSNFLYYSTNYFTVTAGTHRIKFTGTNTDDQTAFIDNVNIVLGGNVAARRANTGQSIFEDTEIQTISLYPNPVSNTLNIDCSSTNVIVELYDLKGRLISQRRYNSKNIRIDVKDYVDGMYIAKISDNNRITLKKFIVLKN